MRIHRLPQTIRNIGRLRTILGVFAKHGFGEIVERLGVLTTFDTVRGLFRRKGAGRRRAQFTINERIRMMLEDLGPTFIKLGQILATRPDLVPMDLIHELRRLQDDVPPFEREKAHAMIEAELGVKMDEAFESFDPDPLAAASIAQVHRAKLKTGEDVVLKVQRPGLERIIDTDLDILRVLADLLERRIPELQRYQPTAIVEEFARSIHKEIDFMREANNVKKFARNFEGDPGLYVPKVYDQYTTERVLCMEFIDGIRMSSDEIMERDDLDRELLVKTGIRVMLTQTYVHGFFHADPHPGNIFVLPGNVICLIDFGMMGSLDQERLDELLGFIVGVLLKDTDRIVRLFRKNGLIDDEHVDVRLLKLELRDLIDRYYGVEVTQIDVGRYIQEIFDVITRHEIILPPDLLLVGKALATIDGIARDVCPEIDPVEALKPMLLKIYSKRLMDPRYHLRDFMRAGEDFLYLLQTAPSKLRTALDKLAAGELRLNLSQVEAERILEVKTRAQNRLSVAIVMSTLFIASLYLWLHPAETLVLGVRLSRVVAVGGLGMAAMFFMGFVYGQLRSGGQ